MSCFTLALATRGYICCGNDSAGLVSLEHPDIVKAGTLAPNIHTDPVLPPCVTPKTSPVEQAFLAGTVLPPALDAELRITIAESCSGVVNDSPSIRFTKTKSQATNLRPKIKDKKKT